jgi:hypothetical protein
MNAKVRLLLVLACFVVSLGCTGGPKRAATASLSGKITYKNQPVTAAALIFHPADGNSPPVTATIVGTNGEYEVAGLPVGDLKLTVDAEPYNNKKPQKEQRGAKGRENKMSPTPKDRSGSKPFEGTYMPLPKKYAEASTTTLTVTVKAGKNNKDFELTD